MEWLATPAFIYLEWGKPKTGLLRFGGPYLDSSKVVPLGASCGVDFGENGSIEQNGAIRKESWR